MNSMTLLNKLFVCDVTVISLVYFFVLTSRILTYPSVYTFSQYREQ